jgi:hypothetical protein
VRIWVFWAFGQCVELLSGAHMNQFYPGKKGFALPQKRKCLLCNQTSSPGRVTRLVLGSIVLMRKSYFGHIVSKKIFFQIWNECYDIKKYFF